MMTVTQPFPISRKSTIAGWIISGFAIAFLAFDAIMKLIDTSFVQQAMKQLGFRPASAPIIGAILLICTLIYTVPRTAVLGAVLLTGYLGGAVAVQFLVGNPPFETIFPLLFGVIVWLGLFLRDTRVKTLL